MKITPWPIEVWEPMREIKSWKSHKGRGLKLILNKFIEHNGSLIKNTLWCYKQLTGW